jgi:Grx4 family monothiol glutaredoxin
MSQVLEALASTYPVTTPPSIAFLSINAEEVPSVSEEYEVSAVPLVVLQRNGQTLERISGSDAARVRNAVEKYAAKAGDTSSGGFSLPPEQKVTRPKEGEEPTTVPSIQPKSTGHAATDANGSVKNLSGYVPPPAPEAAGGEVDKEALYKRLDGLVKAAPVMLFMKGTPSAPKCGFSRTLVGLLRDRSIRYGFFNILADEDVRTGLKEYSDWPTFPQLYVDGELIGGLDIVCISRGVDQEANMINRSKKSLRIISIF